MRNPTIPKQDIQFLLIRICFFSLQPSPNNTHTHTPLSHIQPQTCFRKKLTTGILDMGPAPSNFPQSPLLSTVLALFTCLNFLLLLQSSPTFRKGANTIVSMCCTHLFMYSFIQKILREHLIHAGHSKHRVIKPEKFTTVTELTL